MLPKSKVNRWIGGCAHEHFVEAKLLFNLHKVRIHAQSAPTINPYNTSLEGVLDLHLDQTKFFGEPMWADL